MKRITLELIKSYWPCYSPDALKLTEEMGFTPLEFIAKFENKVRKKSDLVWLLCRRDFMSLKDICLFMSWCARQALDKLPNPDARSVNACDVIDRFAVGDATREELKAAAYAAAADADADAAYAAYAAYAAADAADAAAAYAAYAAGVVAAADMIDKLKTYFEI